MKHLQSRIFNRLSRVVIIKSHGANEFTVDVNCLFDMTDEEMLTHHGIGSRAIAELNDAREKLKDMLFLK